MSIRSRRLPGPLCGTRQQGQAWPAGAGVQPFLLEVTAKTFFGGTNKLDTEEGILQVMEKLAELKPNVRHRGRGPVRTGFEVEIPMPVLS